MNKADAKRIAEDITNDQLAAMFERAKAEVKDWTKASPVNPSLSLGAAWNIYYPYFLKDQRMIYLIKANMVRCFGDYLDESFKTPKKSKPAAVDIHHEDPVFEVKP